MSEIEEPAYIARASCGCILMAIADDPDDSPEEKKVTAREVAKAINRGLTVERVEAQYVRNNMRPCPHKKIGEP